MVPDAPYLVLLLVMAAFWYMMYLRQSGGSSGGGPGQPLRPRPHPHSGRPGQKVTFQDVGRGGGEGELREIVDFLRDPQKFISLGARIPKGVLLVGPPGTGKTLIAKAVAGEAGSTSCPSPAPTLWSVCGRRRQPGPRPVRSGQEGGPAIVFIDEIDAVGRQRGAGLGGGDEAGSRL